jgi:hypothetical protein
MEEGSRASSRCLPRVVASSSGAEVGEDKAREAPLTEDLEFRRLWMMFSRRRAATTLRADARLHALSFSILARRRPRPAASYQSRRPCCLLMRGTRRWRPRCFSSARKKIAPTHARRAASSAPFHSGRRHRRDPAGRKDASDWGRREEERSGQSRSRVFTATKQPLKMASIF